MEVSQEGNVIEVVFGASDTAEQMAQVQAAIGYLCVDERRDVTVNADTRSITAIRAGDVSMTVVEPFLHKSMQPKTA